MVKTLVGVDVDEDLLIEAATDLGTVSESDTLTAALRRVVETSRARRRQALASLRRRAAAGGFHFDRLVEVDQ